MTTNPRPTNLRRWAVLGVALLTLNAALTFENVWPTPAIVWKGGISVELAVCLVVLGVLFQSSEALDRSGRWLSAIWILLAIARYAEVTAPSLYGRDVNLYWDFRLLPDVAAMVTRVAPWWLTTLALAVMVLVLGLLYWLFRWCFGRVAAAMADPPARRFVIAAGALAIGVFAFNVGVVRLPGLFPSPVVQTYAHQARLVADGLRGSPTIPPSPPLDSTFSAVQGADVFLVFIESYGAIADRPDVARSLEPGRAQFDADVSASGRRSVSAYVESPTFGGSSWLAHISLLTGIEVRDPDTNARLMTQHRDTLVSTFARHGYRTLGLMPGLRQKWPEGAFYRFDEIYGADRLAYVGPEFGWFALPDQFTLARFDVLEARERERPRFVFFPTISTHFPFSPTPPYQPEWSRMLDRRPYDGPAIVRAYARQPDWTNFTPGYVEALSYDLAVLGGYLKRHADRDLVMILIGDHQPPAVVTGEGASWNVPVHVVSNRQGLLDRLVGAGFQPGSQAHGPSLAKMHALLPLLLEAFGSHD